MYRFIHFQRKQPWFAGLPLFILGALLGSANAANDPLVELRQFVDTGGYEKAYEFAQNHPELLGNPHFDFLYGVSAIHTSHHSEGVLALERHLSLIPANDRARLELARGYFELGDYLRARQEFEFVLKYNPPKEVQANIQRYLDAMRTRESAAQPSSARRYLEIGGGYDSNINSGTYNDIINLPNPFPIDQSGKAVGANFWQLSGGTQWVKRVTPRFAVYAGADFDAKQHPGESDFDTTNLGGFLGFSVFNGPVIYRLSLADGLMYVGHAKYRNTLSVTGEAQYGLGNGYSLTGVAQYAELTHNDANEGRDSRLLTFLAGAQKSFDHAWRPTLGMQVSIAEEENLHSNEPLGRDMLSGRFFWEASPSDKFGILGGITWQSSQFKAPAPAFGTSREDELWGMDIGINYAYDKQWIVRAEFQVNENDSNHNLFSYKRKLIGLKTRYLF